jgi:hypothetical protein
VNKSNHPIQNPYIVTQTPQNVIIWCQKWDGFIDYWIDNYTLKLQRHITEMEVEQMMARLLAEIRTNRENMDAKQEMLVRMEARIEASNEKF